MTSTVLVRDVLWSASVLLQDTVPQFTRQPEIEAVDWLNDAQVAITKFLPAACSRLLSIKLKGGTLQGVDFIPATDYKLEDGSTPTVPLQGTQVLDALCNMGADGLTPGKVIRLTERKILDSQSPMWHTLTGTAVGSWMFDPRTPRSFLVTPGVGGLQWARVALTTQPIRIPTGGIPGSEVYRKEGSNSQVISINDEHRDDLINYIVARANMREVEWADGAKAQAFSAMFLNSLNAKVTALTGNNPNLTQLPFAAEPIGRAKK